jgi:hypothetical protein
VLCEVAHNAGKEGSFPEAQETLQLGLNLLSRTHDGQLQSCCYSLCSELCTLLEDNMWEKLPHTVQIILGVLKSEAMGLVSNGSDLIVFVLSPVSGEYKLCRSFLCNFLHLVC